MDARTLKLARTFAVGGVAALSPAEDQAAFGHADGSITLVDLRSGHKRTFSGRASGSIQAASFSRDGGTLATAADDGNVAVWDVRTGTPRETLDGHAGAVQAVVFSTDGRTLYAAGNDGSVIVFDVNGARRLGQPFRYSSRTADVTGSAVSPNGSLFALSPGPDHVMLWRSRTRTPLTPALRGPVGEINGLAFSRDGKFVAAAGNHNTVLWSVTTRKILTVLPVRAAASKVAFSPDGHTLAIGEVNGIDALYDFRTRKEVAELIGIDSTDGIDFSPDGKLLASASLSGTVTLWNVAAQSKYRDLPGANPVYAVRFSPDGKLVAVGDSSGAVFLWNASSGKRVGRPLTGQSGGVASIDFDPNGGTLVTTSSHDAKLRLWDVATRKLIGELAGSTTGGYARFFPDGKQALDVFASGAGIVWNVDPAAWKAKACRIARRNLTRAEWTEFLGARSYRNVCP